MHSTTVHYIALCGGLHEICSAARSFDLRCDSVTYIIVLGICTICVTPHVHLELEECMYSFYVYKLY